MCETKEKCQNAFVHFVKAFYNEKPAQKNSNFNILIKKPFLG